MATQPNYSPFGGALFAPISFETASGALRGAFSTTLEAGKRAFNPLGSAFGDLMDFRGRISGQPLIGPSRMGDAPTPSPTPVLPSGTLASGADIYPTAPQRPAAASPTPFDYNRALRPEGATSITSSPFGGPYTSTPFAQQRAQETFATPSFSESTLTAMREPAQQGRTTIQTPYGTISATPEQAKNFTARDTAYVERTPEQQQALIAQMRQRGAELGRQRVAGQEAFFAQKRAERAALANATVEAYESGASPQSIREARAAYTSQQPSSIAGIQRQYAAMAPAFDRPMAERTAFVREPFGIPSGGPQPATGFANSFPFIEDRNRNPFSSIYGFGA